MSSNRIGRFLDATLLLTLLVLAHFPSHASEFRQSYRMEDLIQWKPIQYRAIFDLNCKQPRTASCQAEAKAQSSVYEMRRQDWLNVQNMDLNDFYLMQPNVLLSELKAVFEHQSTKVRLQSKENSPTAILVHGLFEDGYQMSFFENSLYGMGFNVINLVLSGHGVDTLQGSHLKSENWKADVRAAMQVARQLSDQVMLVGDSTGGLLLADLAAENSSEAKALVLVEPALRTQQYIALAACATADHFNQAQELNGLAKIFAGRSVPMMKMAVSIPMACQVDVLRRKISFQYPDASDSEGNFQDTNAGLDGLYRRIRIPTLILANDQDLVVSNDEMRRFAKLNKKSVRMLDTFTKGHGQIPLANEANSELKKFAQANFNTYVSMDFLRGNFDIVAQKILSDAKLLQSFFENTDKLRSALQNPVKDLKDFLLVHDIAFVSYDAEKILTAGKRLSSLGTAENPKLQELAKMAEEFNQLIEEANSSAKVFALLNSLSAQKVLIKMNEVASQQSTFAEMNSYFAALSEKMRPSAGQELLSAAQAHPIAAKFQDFLRKNSAQIEELIESNRNGELQLK